MSGDQCSSHDNQRDSQVSPPAVSIGLPVYNGERYIKEAIESVLRQLYTDFELLISDNCSTDHTEEICRAYASKDSRIKFWRQSENIGPRNNFIFVMKEAQGIYFSWLAHDDYLKPDFIDELFVMMRNNPALVAVSGDFEAIDGQGTTLRVEKLSRIRYEIPWSIRAREFFVYPMSNSFFVIYGMLQRECALKAFENSPRGPLMAANELPFLARMAVCGEIASISSVLRVYRYHDQSWFQLEREALHQSRFMGAIKNIYNIAWRRFDQVYVLLTSTISVSSKIGIFTRVVIYYISGVFRRMARLMGLNNLFKGKKG